MKEKFHQGSILVGPHQLGVDITNKCNFRCLHCYNASGENCTVEDELTDEQFINLMKDIGDMKLLNLCFCGGEPLLRKDLLCKSAKILRDKGIHKISMVTNGYLLNEDIARELYDSGITRFQVSLDGKDAETHEKLRMKEGSFEKAIKAIKIFRNITSDNVDVSFCPTLFSIDQIEEIYDLCKKLSVDSLRVQPLMEIGRANENLEKILPTKSQYRILAAKIHELVNRNEMRVEWGDPIDHIIRFKDRYKDFMNFGTIKSNGGIAASPYLPIVVGNVKKHRFSEYWEKGYYKVFSHKQLQVLADRVLSVYDLKAQSDLGRTVWIDNDIEIDIIEESHAL